MTEIAFVKPPEINEGYRWDKSFLSKSLDRHDSSRTLTIWIEIYFENKFESGYFFSGSRDEEKDKNILFSTWVTGIEDHRVAPYIAEQKVPKEDFTMNKKFFLSLVAILMIASILACSAGPVTVDFNPTAPAVSPLATVGASNAYSSPTPAGAAPALATPVAPAAGSGAFHDRVKGLKYQPVGSGACNTVPDPMLYPACILQRVQSGELTGEQAVVMIQELAAKYNVPTTEAVTIKISNTQAGLFWCPAGFKEDAFMPDYAQPLKNTRGAKWAETLFVIDAGTGGPDRVVTTANTSYPCWMVKRH